MSELNYKPIFNSFAVDGEPLSFIPCKIGLINTTHFVKTENNEYVLQRINTNVFKKPHELMSNYAAVTEHLQKKNIPTLHLVPTKEGKKFYECEEGVFRITVREPGETFNSATPDLLERGGEAYGRFSSELADFDASTLYETIPNFHNTKKRVEALQDAVATAETERLANAAETVKRCLAYASQGGYLVSLMEAGELPLRVVHNDTKINNVLIGDDDVVLDHDTVMPGSILFDFGDAIRSGASNLVEGDQNTDGFAVDAERYEAFLKGFLRGTKGALTPTEIKLLPFSAFVMTYEVAVRFLTDYLSGDTYFHTSYPGENLVRAKGQLTLAENIFKRLDELSAIAKKYVNE